MLLLEGEVLEEDGVPADDDDELEEVLRALFLLFFFFLQWQRTESWLFRILA